MKERGLKKRKRERGIEREGERRECRQRHRQQTKPSCSNNNKVKRASC